MTRRVSNPGIRGGARPVRLVNSFEPCGGRKPVSQITDRAKRYRANSEACRPKGERVCLYCGSKRNVEVGHKDGNEDHGKPSNLAYTCKSCNAKIAAVHKATGKGKRTRQYNPGRKAKRAKQLTLGAQSSAQWLMAVQSICRRDADGSLSRSCTPGAYMPVNKAVEMIRDTPPSRRRQFAADIWRVRGRRGTNKRYSEVPF